MSPTRFRIPDLCVYLGSEPDEQVFTQPPFLCIEILSPEDTLAKLQDRLNDYVRMGVPCCWVIDPAGRRGWIATHDGMREAANGVLRASPIHIMLDDLFV